MDEIDRKKCRSNFEQDFTAEGMAQNYLNIYQRLAREESIIDHSFGRSAELDEARITEQYYIATKSSPIDDRAGVLKYGGMFSVFDHLGRHPSLRFG